MKRKLTLTILIACLCLLTAGLLAGCGDKKSGSGVLDDDSSGDTPASREFFAMDTYMTVSAYGDNAEEAVEKAEAEVHRLDAMLSTGEETSEIAKLNRDGSAVLSKETGNLVKYGLDLWYNSEWKFDIAIYPVMQAWGFTDKRYRVPASIELEELLRLIDAEDVHYDEETREVTFAKKGMAIDLGGIAKGYASARIMEIYKGCGIKSGLVSLGGNVHVLGKKPDGSPWRVAVQDPDKNDKYMGVLEAEDQAVITSGPYERNFEEDGKVYHHIMDPETATPAKSGLKSATVVSKDSTLADALSTTLFIMGRKEASRYWREHSDQFDFILMDNEGEIYVTEPIADRFTSEDYHITVVKKR